MYLLDLIKLSFKSRDDVTVKCDHIYFGNKRQNFTNFTNINSSKINCVLRYYFDHHLIKLEDLNDGKMIPKY